MTLSTLRAAALAACLLLISTARGQQGPPPIPTGPNIPTNMKPYFIAFLLPGKNYAPAPESDPLIQKHLAYIRQQVEAGKFIMAGPLLDQGRILGMAIVNAATAEEAKRLVDADPFITSGRGLSEVHPGLLPDLSGVKVDYSAKP